SVIDEDVDTTEGGRRFFDIAGNYRSIGKIADRRMRHSAVSGNFLMRSCQRFAAPRADRHAGPGLSKGQRDGAPDTAAPSGDDGTLPRDVDLHVSSSGSSRAACSGAG